MVFGVAVDVGRLGKQLVGANLERCEVLVVELVVVVVAELLAEQRQIGLADDDGAALSEQSYDALLLVEGTGILQCFVVVSESGYLHEVQSAVFFDVDVEVAHHVVGEVVFCQLIEQLVFVERVGLVGNHEDEVDIAVGRELARGNGVAVGQDGGATFPDTAEVELAALQSAACLYSVDYHACQSADVALRVFLDDGRHVLKTAVGIARVELAHAIDEDEIVAVGSQGESVF